MNLQNWKKRAIETGEVLYWTTALDAATPTPPKHSIPPGGGRVDGTNNIASSDVFCKWWRRSSGPWARKLSLQGLMTEARKYATFEEFEKAWLGDIKHGLYWHVTDDPNFTINPERGPRDMSSMAGKPTEAVGALMVTSDLEHWANYYKTRPYAAQIDLSDVPPGGYRQVSRGFGNEFYLAPEAARLAKVVRVLPLKSALAVASRHHSVKPQSVEALRSLYEEAHSA